MTRDEIIKALGWHAPTVEMGPQGLLRRVEALVAQAEAAERERIIAANAPEIERINAELSEWKKFPMAAMLAAEKAVDAAIALEREACAELCASNDSRAGEWLPETRVGIYFAELIRMTRDAK